MIVNHWIDEWRIIMRKLFLSLVLLSSVPALAETIVTLKFDETLNGLVAKWPNGRHYDYGFPFSIRSNKNGICKLMGYDEAAPHSVKIVREYADIYRFGFFVGETSSKKTVYQKCPVINEDGVVEKEAFSRMIDEIKCIKY